MSDLTFNPGIEAQPGDKLLAVPALTAAVTEATGLRRGLAARTLRRRFSATRALRANDDGFRPFRVY
jgi:hypothetical protein